MERNGLVFLLMPTPEGPEPVTNVTKFQEPSRVPPKRRENERKRV